MVYERISFGLSLRDQKKVSQIQFKQKKTFMTSLETFVEKNPNLVIYADSFNYLPDSQDLTEADLFLEQGLLQKQITQTVITTVSKGETEQEGKEEVLWRLTEDGYKQALKIKASLLSPLAQIILSLVPKVGFSPDYKGPKYMSSIVGASIKETSAAYKELSQQSIMHKSGISKGYFITGFGEKIRELLTQQVASN